LRRGVDAAKDQSYFLFSLTQDQLACALFPVGDLPKDEVREHARRRRLPVADKPDSQEICFIPDNDYRTFVTKSVPEAAREGQFVDEQGRVLGSHAGVHRFTVGQRKGLGLAAQSLPRRSGEAATPGPIMHVPTVMGAVVLTYNVEGLKTGLRLTPDLIADIFSGRVVKWNDGAIAKVNPGIELPARDIVVVHRSDGSGTSYIFTDYLSKVSSNWRDKVGRGTAVSWPVGLGGKGNEGVTGLVKQTPNAIGYVELVYAVQNKLPYADIKNRTGNFVTPTLESVTAAAAATAAKMPEDFRVSITDPAAADAYPIASFTWLLVPSRIADADKGKAIIDFLG